MANIPFSPEQEAKDADQDTTIATLGTAASVTTAQTAVDTVDNGKFDITTAANFETHTTDAGAISVTKILTNISSAGAETRTLAAPSTNGQLKIIQMTVDGGDVTVAATNIGAGTGSATFDDVGDCLILFSAGSKWHVLGGTAVIA